jgi:hypothetical protein
MAYLAAIDADDLDSTNTLTSTSCFLFIPISPCFQLTTSLPPPFVLSPVLDLSSSTSTPTTMLKVAALFPLLATLASAAWKEGYAPKDNSPCYVDGQDGVVKGTLCVVVSHVTIVLTSERAWSR